MNHSIFYNPDQCVYPGEFVPKSHQNKSDKLGDKQTQADVIKPPVNLIELPELLRIDIAIPGAKREDFVLEIKDHILKVFVETTPNLKAKNTKERMHEFNSEKYERHIPLPGNADTTIIYAEYQGGILRIHIPKSEMPDKNNYARIVVY